MTSKQAKTQKPLDSAFESILENASDHSLSMRQICDLLVDREDAVLMVILSFPVCFPITLPGLCEPVGLVLAFLGVRMAVRKHMWWPDWILGKKVPSSWLKMVIVKAQHVSKNLQKVMRPRLTILISHPVWRQIHGILICCLSLLLALPLPIPFINTFAAAPIFILGLGLLEDDGFAIILAYLLAVLCFIVFGVLFWLGISGMRLLWSLI